MQETEALHVLREPAIVLYVVGALVVLGLYATLAWFLFQREGVQNGDSSQQRSQG